MRVDGHALADEVLGRLVGTGCLATVVAADDDLSHRQAELKHRACDQVGMRWRAVALSGRAATEDVCAALDTLAADRDVDGIFLHLPLPPQTDEEAVLEHLPAGKDVDGLRADSPFEAASAHATVEVLRDWPLSGSEVVIVGGASALVRGLERLLAPLAAHVIPVDPSDTAATERARQADVVVAAAYRRGLVDADWVRPGAAVVDAASGDVDTSALEGVAGLLCASPGGIGPLTVSYLLAATEAAATRVPHASPGTP